MNRNLFLFMLLFLFTVTACVSEVAKQIHESNKLNEVKAGATAARDKEDEHALNSQEWTDEESSLGFHLLLAR